MKYALYLAIPLAYVAHHAFHGQGFEPILTFVLAGIGVLPLAKLMGEATEHLAEKTGPTIGGLLNATFGNAAELIIALIALSKGLNEIVKASLTGSIIGNLLLVGGGAMLFGGWKRKEQNFSKAAAETYGGLLLIAVAGMLVPAIFHASASTLGDKELPSHDISLATGTSVVLLVVYALGLLFTLRTHTYIFSPAPKEAAPAEPAIPGKRAEHKHEAWSTGKSITMLLIASAAVAFLSELLVGSAEKSAEHLGWSPVFVGVILLAIIGNAAEHSTALLLARDDDMDTALTITNQSSLQIALFVAPVLVFASLLMSGFHVGASHPLDLLFTPLEIIAVLLTVLTTHLLAANGRSNWFEGALLLALYALLALAFFYMPVATAGENPTTVPSR